MHFSFYDLRYSKLLKTRLLSNLRPTTRECMTTFSYVTKTVVTPFDSQYLKTLCCTQSSSLCFTEPELLLIEVLNYAKMDF